VTGGGSGQLPQLRQHLAQISHRGHFRSVSRLCWHFRISGQFHGSAGISGQSHGSVGISVWLTGVKSVGISFVCIDVCIKGTVETGFLASDFFMNRPHMDLTHTLKLVESGCKFAVLLKKKEHELAMSETALFQFQIYIR
jgi:hypothetical protein